MDLQSALALIFKDTPDSGTYLHIGAHDGITDNPTYPLYRRGWSGVCVEPLTKYFNKGTTERPKDRWVKGVVVASSYVGKRVSLWVSPDGRFSGLHELESLAIIWWTEQNPGKPFPGMKKQSLKALRVNDDVPRNRFVDGLDLMLIDTNGTEDEVMSTTDLGLWKPHIVAIPTLWHGDAMTDDYFNSMGYNRIGADKVDGWMIYSNVSRDVHAL